ncbi:tRNA (guanine-N7)-methyltransferase, partial [Roseomonas sp. DSM 102946]|nr:tRNA (guanine-N7)-methyltransferase [Roseomonas sp. DSM 102946]
QGSGNIYLMFPDPWPKSRHAKRRFVHPAMLPLVARVLRPGGEWRMASDHPVYQAWVEEVFAAQDLFEPVLDVRERPADWPGTRYEAKAHREGRQPRYWIWRRR